MINCSCWMRRVCSSPYNIVIIKKIKNDARYMHKEGFLQQRDLKTHNQQFKCLSITCVFVLQVLVKHRKPLHMEFHWARVFDHPGKIRCLCKILNDDSSSNPQTGFVSKININLIMFVTHICFGWSPLKVNLLAFGVIIYKVYRHTAVKKPEISHYENIR